MTERRRRKAIKVEPGAVLTRHADGSVTAKNKSARIEQNAEGITRIHIEKIKKISLENLVDVSSHTIKRDQTAVSHHVVFRRGGELRFSYRPDGKLLEFRFKHLLTNFSDDGEITVGQAVATIRNRA